MEDNHNENDLISVVVPLYNSGRYIGECIQSIINQTYKNLEIILVDDGSTDNAGEICDEYARKDSRINVVHKPNSGAADSRNKGIELTKGKYIHFVDSDDVENPKIIELLHNEITSSDADYVFSDFTKFYEGEDAPIKEVNDYKTVMHDKYDIFSMYYELEHDHEIIVIPTCKLYKREFFDDVRFPIGKKGEDELTTYKLIDKSDKILEIKASLYGYRRYPGTLSSDWRTKPRHYMVEAFKEELEFFENKNEKKVIPLLVKRMLIELKHNYDFHLPETECYGNDFKHYYDKYSNDEYIKSREFDDFYASLQ